MFLEKYISKNIPDKLILKKKNYIDNIRVYEKKLTKIQSYVFNRKIWVSIDETTDGDGGYVANIIVDVFDSKKPGKFMLVHCEHKKE